MVIPAWWVAVRSVPVVKRYGMKALAALLLVVIVVGWTVGAIKHGKNECQLEVAQEIAKKRSEELAAFALEAQKRQPIIETAVKKRVELQGRIDRGREKLNEATEVAGSNAQCDLTDDELRALTEIGS